MALSALYEATATVAKHEGEQPLIFRATAERARLLRETTGDASPDSLLAALDVADAEAQYRSPLQADRRYVALAAKAKAAGQPAVAARVALHHAMMLHSRKREVEASELLNGVISGRDGAPASYRLVGRALAARFARERRDIGAIDELVADLARQPQGSAPLLIWSPPTPKPGDTVQLDHFNVVDTQTRSNDHFALGWVDIGFTIRNDGTVEAPDVLRGNRDKAWAAPLLTAIAARRYAPLSGGQADLQYRVERWTLTADYGTPTGSLVARRIRSPHYEQLDITGEPPKG